jgi:hypothetical protein
LLPVTDLYPIDAETYVEISARYHNLFLAMILDKPVMALSDHAMQVSLDPPICHLFAGRELEEVL